MATKKSQSISSQLIKGAYTSAKSGSYQKSTFNLDFSGIEKALNAQAAIVEQQKARMEEALDFQPALGKVGKQDQGPLLDYFSNVKNQMADIHTQMQGADQETRIKLQGELSRLKQTAVTANETLTQRSQISEDFSNSIKDISGSMDPYRMEQLNKLHVEKDYTPIIQDGEIAYQLPDGSVLTNKEANDFKLKAYDQQKKINNFANTFHTTGSQNKPITPDTINATRQDLMKDLDKDSINSLKVDSLLAGYDLVLDDEREYAAINKEYGTNYKVGDELTDEHERYGIANNIVMQLQNVHKSGKGEYDRKKAENKKDNLPRFAFGQKDNIRGANGMVYKWDAKQKGYVEQKFDGVAYVPSGTVITDADEMNQFMVSPKFQLANI
jgi:hypothetical protein